MGFLFQKLGSDFCVENQILILQIFVCYVLLCVSATTGDSAAVTP